MLIGVLWMVVKRLWHNRRLAAGLLGGYAVAVALVSSLPVYSSGALQVALQADLRKEGRKAGSLVLTHQESPVTRTTLQHYEQADRFVRTVVPGLLALPVTPMVATGSAGQFRAEPEDPQRVNPTIPRRVNFSFFSDLDQKVTIVDGRMYRPGLNDQGELEAIVHSSFLEMQEMTVDNVLLVRAGHTDDAPVLKARVVGVFRATDPADPYWFADRVMSTDLIIPEQTFRDGVLALPSVTPNTYHWYLGIEGSAIRVADIPRLLNAYAEIQARVARMLPDTQIFSSPGNRLEDFRARAESLRMLLLVLSLPVLALLLYYLSVTAGQVVDSQRQEIAVWKSRGASLWHVLAVYLIEAALIALVALAIGLPLGLFFAQVIGSTNGFLSFVNRGPLQATIDLQAVRYGLVAVLTALAATLLPAAIASGHSIVSAKQEQARAAKAPLWQRYFLDVLLGAAAWYTYYTLANRPFKPELETAPLEPLHFILPALLIGAGGLFLLRCFPFVVGLVTLAIRGTAGPSTYLAFTQVARSPRSYGPLVLLLVLTVGLGVYSASAARTIDVNDSHRRYFRIGADMSAALDWVRNEENGAWEEPPFEVQRQVPGIVHMARVYAEDLEVHAGGRSLGRARVLGVDTDDFGKVAWYRPDLSRHHFFAYLNLMAGAEDAVLMDQAMMARYRLQPGDQITVSSRDIAPIPLTIYAGVPFWPSIMPGKEFLVANLHHIHNMAGMLPYQAWYKLEPSASVQEVVKGLQQIGTYPAAVRDARTEVIAARRDPGRTALYGMLTMGFIIAGLVTVLGYFLFGALSLRSRLLQMGVLRALGLPRAGLLWALVLEQLLTVGTGIVAGTLLGLGTARLFLPLLQRMAVAADGPPFITVSDPLDRVRLYMVLGIMLVAGLAALASLLGRLKIGQALKLGEDG